MLSPITQQILKISDLRDIKALRNNITLAVNSLLDINNSELIHRLEYRNTSGSLDEPTTLYAYHKTSTNGDIEKEPIPMDELISSWPEKPSYSHVAEKPNIVPMKMHNGGVEYLKFYSDDLNAQIIADLEALTTVYCNQCELILNAEQDQLTGLYNRQAFARITAAMFSTQQTDSIEFHQLEQAACMAIVDLDHFKRVNDKFGHLYGDEVLLLFAQLMKKTLRNSDYIFRYGGEEFVIILNDTDYRQASIILNRLREEAESFDYPQIGSITISIGYALMEKELGISSIIDMADSALYFSKDNGRNQINNYYDLRDGGLIVNHPTDQTINIF
jgi:diguanylate cyclase (GGDEF)-like protein